MASAILATRNETAWPSSKNHIQPRTSSGFMGKIPFLNPNPNPNPNPRKNHQFHQNGDDFANHHRPAASDDASSFNHHRRQPTSGSVPVPDSADVTRTGGPFSHYVSFDISSYSKSELRSLKTRFIAELDRVRSLSSRIESGEMRSVVSNPKKRPMPLQPPGKDPKRMAVPSQGNVNGKTQPMYVASPQMMKSCGQVLTKLMKQKAGYVFNSPVDVEGMKLHDYYQIVKRPMDLGTIKANLRKNLYPSPDEFAADVRLTFNNALLYNPKGHEVHVLAEQFLDRFEHLFRQVYHKFQQEKQQHLQQQQQSRVSKVVENRVRDDPVVVVVDEVQGSSWSKHPSPEVPKMVKKTERVEPSPRLLEPPPRPEPVKAPTPPPVPTPAPVAAPAPAPAPAPTQAPMPEVVPTSVKGSVGRGSSRKLPKPKAKDPNKREMSMEEKHKLGAGLQSLPDEKMVQVIQIIKKRNGHLTQDGDEIELDIEAVDTETLWELDRFVTNYKKMVSKIKRQPLMGMLNNNVGHHEFNQAGASERMETGKAKRGGDFGDDDLDIGDEMPMSSFPPLEIEKDDDQQGGASSSSSSSSSSGSDSSSSSDSDSGSSSGSDSDVDDAQSRDNGSKNHH